MVNPALMHRCLDLASRGRGRVGNGALVGAVLVRDGTIIAEGFHAGLGEAHAERALLDAYRGTVTPQDVLCVNLEPCCHHGMTPPCTNLLIERGIKTVVYGMLDPDSRVSGQGVQILRAAGINVIGPLERALCERVNRGFISLRTKSRPWITVKEARDSQAAISNDDGSFKKITSADQDAWSHTFLRARHDAILVGVGSIICDNPQLNSRFDQRVKFTQIEGLNEDKNNENNFTKPYRIVLDPQCHIPIDAKVVTDDPHRTTVCINEGQEQDEKVLTLSGWGVHIISLPMHDHAFDWVALWSALTTPTAAFTGITSILVEGGQKTWSSFHEAGYIDEEVSLIGQ